MTAAGSDWGLYVHIPFCQARCTYCDFNTITGMGESEHIRYADALLSELGQKTLPDGPLVSLYFGGGTPSLVAPSLLARVIGAVLGRVEHTAPLLEITVETNPGTVSPAKLNALRQAGVNRLSIGAQALQNHHLTALNRIHDSSAVEETVQMARGAGFRNISLDAIYGLPGQTMAEWQETVDGLIHMGPEHLSLYALIVESGTPLQRLVERGEALLPDPDLVADMADWANTRLTAEGLLPYEISNYARPGMESRHNRLYWQLEPYLALGAGAHAYQPGRRWWNVRGIRRYMELVESGTDPQDGEEILPWSEEMREFVWLGLRQRQGVHWDRFQERFGVSLAEAFATVIAELDRKGLVSVDHNRMVLSERGRDMANVVARAWVDAPFELDGPTD